MALTRITCSDSTGDKNTGWSKFGANCLEAVRGIILVPKGYEIATDVLALTKATWDATAVAIATSRTFLLPPADDIELTPIETEFKDTKFGGKKYVKSGQYGWNFMLELPYVIAQNLRAHNGGDYDVFLYDNNGTIVATSPNEVKIKGFSTQLIWVDDDKWSDGSSGHMCKVMLILKDNDEWNIRGWARKPSDWDVEDIKVVYSVEHTVTAILGTGMTVSVIVKGGDPSKSKFQVNGLVVGDFLLKTAAGVTVVPSGVTPNNDGTYTVAATLPNGGYTIGLVACASVSIADVGYETFARTSFTKV
jgi:hypothetical protein